MRNLGTLVAALALAGCGVSREAYRDQVAQTNLHRALHLEEQARADQLSKDVLQLLRTLDALLAERERLEGKVASLQTSLDEAVAARAELMELNSQLAGQRERLTQLTEQISNTWYDSALDRARRALEPAAAADTEDDAAAEDAPEEEGVAAPPEPVEGAGP